MCANFPKAADMLRAEQQGTEANAQLTSLSTTDGMTGIANRRAFDAAFAKEWARAAREETAISVAMIDVDYFKLYNDSMGHLAGDDCLRFIAARLAGAVRRPPDLAARYGGEEFVIMLPGTEADGARAVAARVLADIATGALPHPRSPFGVVSASIGVASTVPQTGSDPALLVGQADTALYAAKQSGRNRVHVAHTCVVRFPIPAPALNAGA